MSLLLRRDRIRMSREVVEVAETLLFVAAWAFSLWRHERHAETR
jgi:hypothetical protein